MSPSDHAIELYEKYIGEYGQQPTLCYIWKYPFGIDALYTVNLNTDKYEGVGSAPFSFEMARLIVKEIETLYGVQYQNGYHP